VRELAAALPSKRKPSPIDHALDHAFATAPAARDPRLVAMLDAVAGRVLARGNPGQD
jgi:5'-methylthioadenosine phosphorylase